ncbi:MAG: glycosyltransferase family 1 protein [bacterium]|nr:glycosyltransferase family 1 protein [bacterium]
MGKNLKVLMISSDRNVLVPESAVSERMNEYGALVEELHIVLLSDARHGLKDKQLSKNVWVYPTNSITSIVRPLDAVKLGKKIIFEKGFVRGQSIITAQDLESGWAGMKVKKKWKIPLEVQLHTDPFSPYFKGFQNMVRKFFLKKVLRNADSVRVVTENLKSRISNLTKARIKVLPIYVDKKKIEESHATFDLHSRYPWRFILLAVSRLAPEKNLGLAIKVLKLVRDRFTDTGLVIVGSGPEEDRLKDMVKKLNLEDAVEFVGWQNPARPDDPCHSGGDLASFYKTANAFIQTSLFEGYGLSLIEAGLYGLPVITTPVGIALELEHGKDAYIYPANNPELFAQGLIDLIENNQKRENLRINMSHTLEIKLISKDAYMAQIKENWESITTRNLNNHSRNVL